METPVQSKLEGRDYAIIMDRSGSMGTTDCNSKSRWSAAQESTEAIANRVCEFDADGITLHVFNDSITSYENVKADAVTRIFNENEPFGGTTLAPVLEKQFADYLKRKAAGQTKANGEMLLVVTDGAPSDQQAVSRAIINFANKLENGDGEYGIQFFQIGQDPQATTFLKSLDDDLTKQGAKWDIVDTKTMEEVGKIGIKQALMAALDD